MVVSEDLIILFLAEVDEVFLVDPSCTIGLVDGHEGTVSITY